jgi:hypothetical protein
VSKQATHSIAPEPFTVRENRMRAQEEWPSPSCIAGEPQVGRRRRAYRCHTPISGHDEPGETRGGAPKHAQLSLLKVVSTSEPCAQPYTSIETFSRRRHPHGRFDGTEKTRVIPPVDTSTNLPAYDAVGPISSIELQRIVNGW